MVQMSSSQNLSGTKRDVHCALCNMFFSSGVQLAEHCQGRKHRRAAGEPIAKRSKNSSSASGDLSQGVSGEFQCVTCNMYFSSENQQIEHESGKKHRLKAIESGVPVAAAMALGEKRKAQLSALGKGKGKHRKAKNKFRSLPLRLQRNLTAYKEFFQPLVELEFEQDLVNAKEKLMRYPLRRLLADGLTLMNLHGDNYRMHKDYHRQTKTEVVYRFTLPGGQQFPNHDMCPGDVIWLSHPQLCDLNQAQDRDNSNNDRDGDHNRQRPQHPVDSLQYIEGKCIFRARAYIVLTVDPMCQPDELYQHDDATGGHDNPNDASSSSPASSTPRLLLPQCRTLVEMVARMPGWRLDKGTSKITHDRCTDAIEAFTGGAFEGHVALRDVVVRIQTPDASSGPDYQAHPMLAKPTLQPDPQWEEALSAEGHPYFWHKTTREVSWTQPELVPVQARSGQMLQDLELDPRVNILPLGPAVQARITQALQACPLNASQKDSIKQCFSQHFNLIQGPPGTGKTTTATYLVSTWCSVFKGKGPVLASAYSNVAVDQIMSGLVAQGISVVRIGNSDKVSEALRPCSLTSLIEEHPDSQRVKQQVDRIKQMSMDANRGGDYGLRKQIAKGWKAVRALEDSIEKQILQEADVVCATCIGCGTASVTNMRFPLVVVDEATQATEPAILIPLALAKDQVVLVGDQCQLPPTLTSDLLQNTGLQFSMFERVLSPLARKGSVEEERLLASKQWTTSQGVVPFILKVQYRMHPIISFWPNQSFYGGHLLDGVTAESRQPPNGFPWPQGLPFAFVPCQSPEEGGQGTTKSNPAEARMVMTVVSMLVQCGQVIASDIGVVTPYSGQVKQLRRMFGIDRKGRGGGSQFAGLEINSVDGYQGREKEVIVFSCVRSNASGSVGFLADVRRLNVAVTRAKRGLVVIGDPTTLCNNETWASYIDFAMTRHLIVQPAALGLQQLSTPQQNDSHSTQSYSSPQLQPNFPPAQHAMLHVASHFTLQQAQAQQSQGDRQSTFR